MKDSTRRRFEELQRGVEFLANLGIVVVVLVGAAVLIKQWQLGRSSTGATRPSSPGSAPPVGKPLHVPGIDFGRSDQTLVLVLSTRCHYCAESGPFYQRLVSQARRNRRTGVAAVFPEDTAESDRFLARLGVSVEKVITLPLSAVGTRGTPTLLLIGKNGLVRSAWIGRLTAAREAEVIEALGAAE